MSPRPRFHFTAASGWINDPHGITWHEGRYHVFFQYVPGSTVWAPNCHWGHATAPDLVSLREEEVAIAPGDGDGGIWTGCLVVDDRGGTRVLYTSTSEPDLGMGRIRLARPVDDGWLRWEKGAVVAEAPEGMDIVAFRDPFVIHEPDGRWRMLVGAGTRDRTAMALAYSSDDLESWRYEGVALSRPSATTEDVWMGALWECPQVFAVDGRWVMVSSVWDDDVLHYAGYAVGDYADGRFEAAAWGRLTWGPSYYAPSFFRDREGRPCLSFWMRGVADPEAGWASAHSVPHVLRLEGDVLVAEPHPDLDAHLDGAAGPAGDGALDVLWSPDRDAPTLRIEGAAGAVVLTVEDGVLTAVGPDGPIASGPVTGTLRVVVDAQAIEVSSPAGLIGFASPAPAETIVARGAGAIVRRLAR